MYPIASILANPYYAIDISPALADLNPELSERQRAEWLETNEKLLLQLGSEHYLTVLLDVLKGHFVTDTEQDGEWSDDQLQRLMINPAYAIAIDRDQLLSHQHAISEGTWIDAASELIQSISPAGFLDRMLTALESPIPELATA